MDTDECTCVDVYYMWWWWMGTCLLAKQSAKLINPLLARSVMDVDTNRDSKT